jgi:uncharacterized protein (DUF1697 family)
VALLRGINLGRNKRVAMGDLRALLRSLGFDDVRTYLQSGNALFSTRRGGSRQIERQIASRIKADLGLDVTVLVRSTAEFSSTVDGNPFTLRGADPKQLYVAFLSEPPPRAKVTSVDMDAFAPDQFEFGDRVIYLRLRNGVIASRLPDWERVLGVRATTRGWNTVTRLRALAG